MNAAIYTDDAFEQQRISEALKQCGMEFLHPIRSVCFSDYTVFCNSLRTESFGLLVIAQNGSSSLELMDAAQQHAPGTPVIWFSDLDFAVRSYEYGVIWFGKKPVKLSALRNAFQRMLNRACGH